MKNNAHRHRQQPTHNPQQSAGLFVSERPADMCIVGGGVAGLSAGIFAARRGCAVCIISADCGGQTASTAEIENYPGCGKIEGPDLVRKFTEEALRWGCHIISDCIESIVKTVSDDISPNIIFTVHSMRRTYSCRALIIASGKSPRRLGVPGEREFLESSIHFAGALDMRSFRGMRVALIGGGNSAMDCAVRLSPYAAEVHIIHRGASCSGEAVVKQRMTQSAHITAHMNTIVQEFRGAGVLQSLIMKEAGERKELPVDAAILAIGFEPRADWYCTTILCTDDGRIIIDAACRTSVPGIFAAGDCTTVPFQQIVISAGEGAKAGLSAYRYLQEKKGKRGVPVDWGYIQAQNEKRKTKN